VARWYRKSADQGQAIAQSELGVLYARGQGVNKDLTEAAKWWRKAADQGSAEAKENLATLAGRIPSPAQSDVSAADPMAHTSFQGGGR
jgi:uncharacterized protein